MCIYYKSEKLEYLICINEIIKIHFNKLKDEDNRACGQLDNFLCNRITIEHGHFL